MSTKILKNLLKQKKTKKYTVPLLYAGMFLGAFIIPGAVESKEIPYSYTTEFARVLEQNNYTHSPFLHEKNSNNAQPLANYNNTISGSHNIYYYNEGYTGRDKPESFLFTNFTANTFTHTNNDNEADHFYNLRLDMQDSTIANYAQFGKGRHAVGNGIRYNLNLNIKNSSLPETAIYAHDNSKATIQSSTIKSLYLSEVNISLMDVSVTESIRVVSYHESYSLSLTNSKVRGAINLQKGNNTVELFGGSMIQDLRSSISYGTIKVTINNSTVAGEIKLEGDTHNTLRFNKSQFLNIVSVSHSAVNDFSMQESNVLGHVAVINAVNFSIKDSTINNYLSVSGEKVTIFNTRLYNTISLNSRRIQLDSITATLSNVNYSLFIEGSTELTINNSFFASGIELHKQGTNNVTITNSTIKSGSVPFALYSSAGDETIHISNSLLEGELNTHKRDSSVTIENSTITADINTSEGDNDYVSLTNSSIGGAINLGAGNNTLILQTMNLGIVSLLQGSNTLSASNSTIANSIATGNGNDNITLLDSTAKNLTGGTGKNNITIERSQLDALILNEGQNTVHVNGATIRGALGTAGNNTISLSESYIGGNISASNFTLTNGLYFQNTAGGGTINRTINAQNIAMNDGFIYTNPNTPGDVLYIEGTVSTTATKSPSFILDTDMSAGVADRVHFDGTVTSPDNVLLVATQNAKTITRTSATVTRVSNVISFVNNTKITLPTLYIGGSKYAFEEGVIPNSWDLVKVGASKFNEGFSAMEASNKRHSTLVWNTLNKRMDNALLEYAMEAAPIGKKVTKKIKRGKKLYTKTFYQWPKSKPQDKITIWANGQANINFLTQKDSLSMHELMAMGTFGVDIKKLDIRNILRFNVHIFGAYGKGMSTIKASDSPVRMDGDINAISAGAFVSMETLKSFKYKYFVRVGVWTDLFQNSLQYNDPTRLQNTDTWGAYAINASVSTGIRINARRFTVVPEVGVAYTYTPGTNFVAGDSALVSFQEDHRLIAKATLLAAYNFKFGLKPYAKIGVEMPFSVAGGGGVYVGDNQRKYIYEINELQAIASIGLNYSVQVRGIDISTYIDVATNLGKKQQGVTGNLGISLGF